MTIDPITFDILWGRLISLTDEMALTLRLTSFSTLLGEAGDFGCVLLDSRGQVIAHATHSMPVVDHALPNVCRSILETHGDDDLHSGDVFITNYPWLSTGQQTFVAIVLPILRENRRIGFAGTIGHMEDIGGALDANGAHEVYDQGLSIPLTRLCNQGTLSDWIADMIRANVRVPSKALGDIHAQVSAVHVGAQRALALLAEFGLEELDDLAEEVHRRSESAMRAAIIALPDGTYTATMTMDGSDIPLPLSVAITIRGDKTVVDYAGSARQLPHKSLNCTMSYTTAHTLYALKCALLPELPDNAGCYRPIQVKIPAGSILNCTFPAPIMNGSLTGGFLIPLVFNALSSVLPDSLAATCGVATAVKVYAIAADGRSSDAIYCIAGGMGGSNRVDGVSTTLFPSGASNISIERFEHAVPVLVREKGFVVDSGGAGHRRGGLGQRLTVSRYPTFEGEVVVSIGSVQINPTEGMLGGCSGRPGRLSLDGRELSREQVQAITNPISLDDPNQTITIETAGGGGFGSPNERPKELIERDVRDGLVSPEAAKRDYVPNSGYSNMGK